jgi:hypothetical protein
MVAPSEPVVAVSAAQLSAPSRVLDVHVPAVGFWPEPSRCCMQKGELNGSIRGRDFGLRVL